MARRLNPLLLRLSRWPRRIAALVCLLLAAASSLVPAGGTSSAGPRRVGNPITAGLAPGQVAVPVTLATGRAASFVHVGDHVGVFVATEETSRAGPGLIADELRVLAVSGASQGDPSMSGDAPVIVVAAGRGDAVHLAAVAGSPVLVVVDKSP